MNSLAEPLRRRLAAQTLAARDIAETAAAAALTRLAVGAAEPFAHLSLPERTLRNRLRARGRQLGDALNPRTGVQATEHLTAEVAYEHWHRMLFARFLAEHHLLMHPDGVAVSLSDCEELAREEGAHDAWELAGRYAARMLPGVFRPEDPVLAVELAPEHQQQLERVLEEIPAEVFQAGDALGWVYQFWQAKQKDAVNASGGNITGDTLAPVTQLFTEPYMVSFLLENAIGAWWAGRHPGQEPPVAMPYLRRLEDGTPAAGTFEGWPKRYSELTVLDPCCGSGHFLVAALQLLVPLRMHDEGLHVHAAVDAVLGENLFGLELDPRCTQIAAFAVALAAWTYPGSGGYRPLPELQIACSGLAPQGKKEDWLKLAQGDQRLTAALERLWMLFQQAPELGSLIEPIRGVKDADLLTAGFHEVQPLLHQALQGGRMVADVEQEANAVQARGIAQAAELLSRKFTLVATNVPYLGRGKQSPVLQRYCELYCREGKEDLAAAFLMRSMELVEGTAALVTPQSWLFQTSYKALRKRLLSEREWNLLGRLGSGAFDTIGGEVVNVCLVQLSGRIRSGGQQFSLVNASQGRTSQEKSRLLVAGQIQRLKQGDQLDNPDFIVSDTPVRGDRLFGSYVQCLQGISTGDSDRLCFGFWEVPANTRGWALFQTVPSATMLYGGRDSIVRWDVLERGFPGSAIRGERAWGKRGVAIGQMSRLPATLYMGQRFSNSTPVIVPHAEEDLPAVWAFCSSAAFNDALRTINPKVSVDNGYVGKISWDRAHWTRVAQEQYPNGLPAPRSDNPTQWLFQGDVVTSDAPLHVAVARLLGYRWPDQQACPALDRLTDQDGIVCLSPVRGERAAVDRVQDVLSVAYGSAWTPAKQAELLAEVGYGEKTLTEWLRDGFFEQHMRLFENRPFAWHIWDGRKQDGFHALVNYHKLDRKTLETLTYSYLGDWIQRQEAAVKQDATGAEARLVAARELQAKLKLILEGEPPHDIFVRWKPMHEQPIGWEPDLNDGVRLNIRPFVAADILRKRPNIKWEKDRGKNPEGSPWGKERFNRYEDYSGGKPLTNDMRRAAREQAAKTNGKSKR